MHLRTLAKRSLTQSAETLCRGHQSDSQKSQYNGQVGKMLKNCTTASTHESIPVVLMHGHRLSVKITNLEVAPTAQSSSLAKITKEVLNTHVQQTVNTIAMEKQNTIKNIENPCSSGKSSREPKDGDCGYQLDLVYDAVMTGQSPCEMEWDGWHADEIHGAVCTWCEMGFFERSQDHGLSPAPGVGTH